jgi:hypothetical protein
MPRPDRREGGAYLASSSSPAGGGTRGTTRSGAESRSYGSGTAPRGSSWSGPASRSAALPARPRAPLPHSSGRGATGRPPPRSGERDGTPGVSASGPQRALEAAALPAPAAAPPAANPVPGSSRSSPIQGGGAAQSRCCARRGGMGGGVSVSDGRLGSRSAGRIGRLRGGSSVGGRSAGGAGRAAAASRRAQSWNVGHTGKADDRQYASWCASARGAGRVSAKQRCR